MATMTGEQFQMLLKLMTDNNAQMMQTYHEEMKKLITSSNSNNNGNLVDTRGVGKPLVFKGVADKYNEWMTKTLAYLRVLAPDSADWVKWSMDMKGHIGDGDIDLKWASQASIVKDFSTKLFSTLITNTEDEAFKIVQSARTRNGLEAMRLLRKRYHPKNPGTKRSILKSIMTMVPCKKISELEKVVLEIEELVKKYESMTDTAG